jgi:antirestriction protein ArdC
MDTSDFAKRLADKLIEQLKAGTAPWQQPWEAGLALVVTGRGCPRWMT